MKAGRQELMDYLNELAIITKTYDHEAVFSVSESENLKVDIPGGHTRNLFLKDKKGNYFLITLGSHAPLDLKTLHTKIGASGRLSFGSAEKLDEFLGIYPRAVNVFCVMNDTQHNVTLVIDETLMKHDLINAHPMTNEATTTIQRQDLLRFIEATGHKAHIIAVSDSVDI